MTTSESQQYDGTGMAARFDDVSAGIRDYDWATAHCIQLRQMETSQLTWVCTCIPCQLSSLSCMYMPNWLTNFGARTQKTSFRISSTCGAVDVYLV